MALNLHDTYQIATSGQNSIDTFTLASNGILVGVEIIDLPDVIIPGGPAIDGGTPRPEEKITRKKICVTATINGKKYEECLIVENKPDLSVKDIDVEVLNQDTKPKIKISFDI